MRKSQQLQINLRLRPADGTPIVRVVYLTVPVLEGTSDSAAENPGAHTQPGR